MRSNMAISTPSRSPTPIIYQTSVKATKTPRDSLATIRACYCSKIISAGHLDVSGRTSPSNDEVRFYYRGTKYKVFVSGKGLYHLTTNDKGDLILVRDKKVIEFPCCDFNFRNLMAMV